MSETPETPETPDDETVEADDDSTSGVRSEVKIVGKLSRDSDKAARPGFRNPSNAKSKAQKKKRKKNGR